MYKYSIFLITVALTVVAHAASFEDDCAEVSAELESLDCESGLVELKGFIKNSASTLDELDKTQAISFTEALETGEIMIIKCLGKYSKNRILNEPMNVLLSAYVKFQVLVGYRVDGKYWNKEHIAQLIQAHSELMNMFPQVIEETYNKSLNTDASKAGAG